MSLRIIQRKSRFEHVDLPVDMHPVLRRIYAARGARTNEDLDLGLKGLLPVGRLKGIASAVDLLISLRRSGGGITIVGDFDADGATSTALVLRALRRLGYTDVDYLVPNRFEYGYGLTPEIVALAAEQDPTLIITVDNGISSMRGVEAANARGVQVIITDHHLPGRRLPPAAAIVNPNLAEENFPSKHLAGVGVAFYLMAALARALEEVGVVRPGAPRSIADFLDLVALGTIADVVPLDRNNRILVQQGMGRIRAGRCVPGILALLERAGRNRDRLVASDLAFGVAPRLNAAGRLDDMSVGIECLLAQDSIQARRLAENLDLLNTERRDIEGRMQEEALLAVEQLADAETARELPLGLCLFDPGWHQGIVGLVASRIKERVHRPVLAFARAGGDMLKGSARSIQGVHIKDVLESVATRHPGLIERFGGHAMAAGLSLRAEALEAFRDAINEELARWLDETDLEGTLITDGVLDPDDLCLATAELLRDGGPWGQGFPEPAFHGVFDVSSVRVVGEKHVKMHVRPSEGGRGIEAIAFHQVALSDDLDARRVRLVYKLDVNEYQGMRSPQLIVEHIELDPPSA